MALNSGGDSRLSGVFRNVLGVAEVAVAVVAAVLTQEAGTAVMFGRSSSEVDELTGLRGTNLGVKSGRFSFFFIFFIFFVI